MPSDVSTAGAVQDRGRTVEELERELAEAHEQQTATSEILRVISSSPTDVQPVFEAIAASALSLCAAASGGVYIFDGELIHAAALESSSPEWIAAIRGAYPMPANRGGATGRAILTRSVSYIPDVREDPEYRLVGLVHAANIRSILAVPMLRDGSPIGAVTVTGADAGIFSERQIALLRTFADQAVIAIENTRLFEAEQASKRELQESLKYQTATSEILGVISRSPTDLKPVLDAILGTAARLCSAEKATIRRREGNVYAMVAEFGFTTEQQAYMRANPVAAGSGTVVGRAAETRRPVYIPDVETADSFTQHDLARGAGFRAGLAVPLLREGDVIGVLMLLHSRPDPFTADHIERAQTFADQAVIAIENTRLFEEVQARTHELTERTRELTETLEYQTATSEVLNVISRSPNELQPVLDTIVVMAERLCAAEYALVRLERDGLYHVMARHALNPDEVDNVPRMPVPADRSSVSGKAVSECRTVHVHDVLADPEDTYAVSMGVPARTILGVPLIRNGKAIGVIVVFRRTVKPFTQRQVDLIATFANQAVIAINNVGLFEEVRARNRDLTALGEVGRAVGSTLDLKVVLKTIVERAIELSGTDAGSIFYYRPEAGRFELGETVGLNEDVVAGLLRLDIAIDQTGLGEAIAKRQPLQISDLTQHSSDSLRDAVLEAGFRASLIVPLFGADGPLGTLVLRRRQPGEFPPAVVNLMQSFADQSAIALENARLFEEIAQKSRELEISSQHKSQFVANMSHELRTPLAAILGYAELMQEGFYGNQSDKSMDALNRIRSNGKHLLGLINTVLDIAKIESGQFTLNMAEYTIESVVETVRSATESLAQNKKLLLTTEVTKPLPLGLGDEQRLTQVLLNLVGNAIKFTETGEVRVTAKSVNGHFAVSVTDTGPGIPEEHQARIFEQFHQVDSSNTKAKGGTGLGLAIAKQIVEMHGGRIWVESTPGKGSTFQMELPTRAEFRKMAP